MKKPAKTPPGASQRQLRTGEIIRHALVDVLMVNEVNDPALAGVSVTVTEARMSADLKHANVFVRPLGGENVQPVVDALNRHAKFIRGELSRRVDLKSTPDLRFRQDESFEAAAAMDALFDSPKVKQDLGGGNGNGA